MATGLTYGGLPGFDVGEVERGDPLRLGVGHAEQAQGRCGEFVDGCLVDAVGVAVADAEEAEQAAGDGAERDVRVGNGEASGRLTDLDVPQRAWDEAARVCPGRPGRRR
jgi:hypothetical protein